jgi:hypothetical protein
MPLIRLSGARIAVLTSSDAIYQIMAGLLTQELTIVVQYRSVDDLMLADRPDVVMTSRELICDGASSLLRLRQRWLTCRLMVIGAANKHDARQLLDIGANGAVVTDDELQVHALSISW